MTRFAFRSAGLLFVLVALLGSMGRAEAQPTADADAALREAVATYADAMESTVRSDRIAGFRRAEQLFRAAIDAGYENAELWTNLGNAALQSERLGQAVLAYRHALLLDPGLERARQNLEHARSLLPDWVPSPSSGGLLDSFFFWHTTTSRSTRAELAALCFALASLGLGVAIARRASAARNLALLPLIGWIALLVSLLLDPSLAASREGVVVAAEAVVRAADSVNAPIRFGDPLPSGSEVRILDDRGGWLQIELHNGRNGWVTSSSVERLASP